MKVGLGCAFNSSEDCVGFVVDKVTLALIFPKTLVSGVSFNPPKRNINIYLSVLFMVTATTMNGPLTLLCLKEA